MEYAFFTVEQLKKHYKVLCTQMKTPELNINSREELAKQVKNLELKFIHDNYW
jgi:hypothetical protein